MMERLCDWLKGHQSAMAFIILIHEIAEIWDDLIDEECVDSCRTNRAFAAALVDLPRNAFYRENFGTLSPLVEMAILDWLTANELEKSKDREKLRSAYVLRCGAMGLIVMSARIIGGSAWANNVNTEMRCLGDSWINYAQKHGVI